MNLPDTFYISLCMTILFIGAIYWVWTQIQYVQRKMNALENIVYELKQTLQQPPPPPPSPEIVPSYYPPAPSSVLGEDEDLLHETLHTSFAAADDTVAVVEEDVAAAAATNNNNIQTVTFEPEKGEFVLEGEEAAAAAVEANHDDLQPGGVGSGDVQHSFALESMTTKELRRLGNQRGISGVNDMKKKEIIAAIRALPNIFGAVGDE